MTAHHATLRRYPNFITRCSIAKPSKLCQKLARNTSTWQRFTQAGNTCLNQHGLYKSFNECRSSSSNCQHYLHYTDTTCQGIYPYEQQVVLGEQSSPMQHCPEEKHNTTKP